MNAKVARKMRQHLQQNTHPDKRKEAEKALKELYRKGLVKFGK